MRPESSGTRGKQSVKTSIVLEENGDPVGLVQIEILESAKVYDFKEVAKAVVRSLAKFNGITNVHTH